MWFNTIVILDAPLTDEQLVYSELRDIALDLIKQHDMHENGEHGKYDRTEDYVYGTLVEFRKECHAIVTPDGQWLDPDYVAYGNRLERTLESFPELRKPIVERDKAKADAEYERYRAAKAQIWAEHEAKWQAHIDEVFSEFAGHMAISVRCHS